MALKIGLIGIVGEEIKQDPWGTLQRVAQIGYQGIEGGGGIVAAANLTPAEIRPKLAALGLETIAQGVRMQDGKCDPTESIAVAKALGARYLGQYWMPCDSADQLKQMAQQLDAVGKECRAAGLTFFYHNHNHEFARFEGQYGLDILLANTDPRHLALELDVAWATYGGADPAAIIRKYAGRCPILHIKDLAALPQANPTSNERKDPQFTEVGTGVVDMPAVVAAARESGVEWLVVEQDRMRDLKPLESIQVSYRNLKKLVG